MKTRTQYGLIVAFETKKVLLMEIADGQWALPGGRLEEGQRLDDLIERQTGVSVFVTDQLGAPLTVGDDTATAFIAETNGGHFLESSAAKRFCFFTQEEVEAGAARKEAYEVLGLKEELPGPEDICIRLADPDHRMTRFLYDAFTILGEYEAETHDQVPVSGILVANQGLTLMEICEDEIRTWVRLDPPGVPAASVPAS